MIQQAVAPIRRHVVVPASPQRAFEVFTAGMTGWWPSEHHIGSAPIDEIVIEPYEGGRWYTRHQDGSETSTGFVAAWEPPARLVLTWQISADWRYDASLVTHVELRFVEEQPGRTRVELEHRDLDRFGPDAERMRQTSRLPTRGTRRSPRSRAPSREHDARRALRAGRRRARARARAHARPQRAHPRVPRAQGDPHGRHVRRPAAGGVDGDLPDARGRRGVRRGDPFVVHGLIRRWELRRWNEILT